MPKTKPRFKRRVKLAKRVKAEARKTERAPKKFQHIAKVAEEQAREKAEREARAKEESNESEEQER